jgi:hypothetical protein
MNLETAETLGLEIPPMLHLIANERIEYDLSQCSNRGWQSVAMGH